MSFIFKSCVFFVPHWGSKNLQTKRFGDLLAAAQAYSVGSWPSQAAGKGISALSALTLCVCSCTAACNAAQRRGDLVKFVNSKIPSVSAERMHTSITQAALIAVLAVCQIFFISLFIQKLRCCFHDHKVVISQSNHKRVFFPFVSVFSVAANTVPFSQVNSHIYFVMLEEYFHKAFWSESSEWSNILPPYCSMFFSMLWLDQIFVASCSLSSPHLGFICLHRLRLFLSKVLKAKLFWKSEVDIQLSDQNFFHQYINTL